MITAKGGVVRGSVTKDVTHLIAQNPYMMTGKMTKAQAAGVEIVSESFIENGKKATVYDTSSVVDKKIVSKVDWLFEDAPGVWLNYAAAAAPVVETAYQDWLKNKFVDVRAVKSGVWIYQIDFNKMEQMNAQHAAHTIRKIRRVAK